MSQLRTILFEDPVVVYLLCAMVAAVAVVAAMALRQRRLVWVVVGAGAVAVAAGLLAATVTTERERLTRAAGALAAAVVAGDAAALDGLIADAYDDGVYDKAAVLERIETVRRRWELREADLSQVEVNITGDAAIVAFRAVVRFEGSAGVYNTSALPTRWRLWWFRREGRWQVTSSHLLEPAGLPGAPVGP